MPRRLHLVPPLVAALVLAGCSGADTASTQPPTAASQQAQIDPAVRATAERTYTRYSRDEVDALLSGTRDFAAAYSTGDLERARHLYPRVRAHFERIEPTAESFGDLDPALDRREADHQPGDGDWTGWHVAEKDLWRPAGYPGLDEGRRKQIAARLVTDTEKLRDLIHAPDFVVPVEEITNGVIGLLEEIASTKVTGEEEIFSHTDLHDIQANLDGSVTGFETIRGLAAERKPALVTEVDDRFRALQAVLDRHRAGDGFVAFTALGERERKELSDAVNALRRPLAGLGEAIFG